VIADALKELSGRTGDQLRSDRRQKYLAIGRQL
jgi:acetyl-CoA carboxylase carboxyl transferase subunit alpha